MTSKTEKGVQYLEMMLRLGLDTKGHCPLWRLPHRCRACGVAVHICYTAGSPVLMSDIFRIEAHSSADEAPSCEVTDSARR